MQGVDRVLISLVHPASPQSVMHSSADHPPVALVGAGAVGSVLARRLVDSGYRIETVLSRRSTDAQALADRVGASAAGSLDEGVPPSVRLVMVCVPDDAIRSVAKSLASLDHPWHETLVAHTSGAHTAQILSPLSEHGADLLSFHPLQTFTPDTPPSAFESIVIGIEGTTQAQAAGETLAQALGARPVRLSAEDKVRYHSAAALASNGLVALMSVVQEVFDTAEVEASTALDLIGPLVEQTLANLQEAPPEEELTGPVARGDVETVEAHLEELSSTVPHLIPLYVALSTEMTRIAERGGQIDAEQAETLLETLQKTLKASTIGTNSCTPLH